MTNASQGKELIAHNAELNAKIEQLKKKSKTHGKLTFEDVTNELSDFDLSAEESDAVLDYLSKESVMVLEHEEHMIKEDLSKLDQIEHEVIHTETAKEDTTEFEGININDPVRMYLKEIGKVDLMSA